MDIVRYAQQVRADAIERACEAALQDGRYGVLVNDDRGTATVSPLVPYGTIECIPWMGGEGWVQHPVLLAA